MSNVPSTSRWTLLAVVCAALLFSTTLTTFRADVVDVGAARILRGEVPYRDFWTMYAPGSFYVVAGAFFVCGQELIVSNVLGLLTAAAGVGVFHRLVARSVGGPLALLPSALFAAAYFGTGYHAGFASYPPAILLILVGLSCLVAFQREGRRRSLVAAGVCFGLTAIFKHDLGAYACAAAAGTIVLAGAGSMSRTRAIVLLGGAVVVVMVPVALPLMLVAGREMAQDLVVFPLTDFAAARPETFPGLLPEWSGDSLVHRARGVLEWVGCRWPLFLSVAALPSLWRRRHEMDPASRTTVLFALLSFPLFWSAAHVQINTHKITLTALAGLLGSLAFLGSVSTPRRRLAVLGLCVVWCAPLVAETGYRVLDRWRTGTEPLGLPRLTGIRAPADRGEEFRGLARALETAAPPGVPLQLLCERNDVHVYAAPAPFWLSSRPIATAHHELHPGITDTPAVQRRMLADLRTAPSPVVVLEHRFPPEFLDEMLARFRESGLPVGTGLVDEWLRREYESGSRYGMYEVLRTR